MVTSERKTWLERRTNLEKYFFAIFFIMLLVVVLFVIAFHCEHLGSCSENIKETCTTSGCTKAASAILESIDPDVNPCDNFFQFACGNALKRITMPNDKQEIGAFTIVQDKTNKRLKQMLEEEVKEDESRVIKLAKKYYKACMNEDRIEETGKEYIANLFKTLGGWPTVDGNLWNETEFEWSSLMKKFRNIGLKTDSFIKFQIAIDTKNSSIRSIEIDQPNFGMAREYLATGQFIDTYHALMVNVSVELGADRIRAEKDLNASLDFEIKLAKIALSKEERRNFTLLYNPMTIKDLQVRYPQIKWLDYINALLPAEARVGEKQIINVVVPEFLSSFEKLIELTPKRVQANFAFWRVIVDIIDYLPQSIYRHYQEALHIINGQTERSARWMECTSSVSKSLAYAVSSLYIRKYFDEETKSKATELVNYIKNEFIKILENVDWMDEDTRQIALRKANNMIYQIGYPSELLDDNVLEKYYRNLDVVDNEYLQSKLNIMVHDTNFKYGQLHDPVNRSDWTAHGSAYKVGAFYIPSENSFEITAGILQGAFFDKNRPMYLNFGAIGSITGHEITHGFDDEGRQLDEYGSLHNWWAKSTEEKFLEKVQCIIQQYSNYYAEPIHEKINGINTQGENVADNGGIKEAYFAYNSWVEKNGAELKLPGLEYTPNELFWIAAAMNWCTKYTDGYLRLVAATDLHSPDNFRVLGPFSNSNEFAKDFNCTLNSKMNPEKKCSVW